MIQLICNHCRAVSAIDCPPGPRWLAALFDEIPSPDGLPHVTVQRLNHPADALQPDNQGFSFEHFCSPECFLHKLREWVQL